MHYHLTMYLRWFEPIENVYSASAYLSICWILLPREYRGRTLYAFCAAMRLPLASSPIQRQFWIGREILLSYGDVEVPTNDRCTLVSLCWEISDYSSSWILRFDHWLKGTNFLCPYFSPFYPSFSTSRRKPFRTAITKKFAFHYLHALCQWSFILFGAQYFVLKYSETFRFSGVQRIRIDSILT